MYDYRSDTPSAPVEKKLTPMEKLKLKMRAGLEKSSNNRRVFMTIAMLFLTYMMN